MIRTEKASFSYVKGRNLFEDVSINVEKGEILAILGPNGAGKTTFIKCLMNFLRFNSGKLFINNTLRHDMSDSDFWKLVGYVPQAKHVTFDFSVLEMTVMGLSPYIGMGRLPRKEEYERAEHALADLGIEGIKHSLCTKISGGQLQMVLIARTLIKEPRILIMDEPESSLDIRNQMKILNVIERLNDTGKVSIVINTHFPAHALRMANKSLIIGRDMHLHGNSAEVVTSNMLSLFFGIEAEIIEKKRENKSFYSVMPISLPQ